MNKKTQSGFAHIVILTVILALALVGTLGFVYWQNFMQPKNDNSKVDDRPKSTPTVNDDTNIAPTATNTNEGYLVLDDWGVKFKLPTDIGSNEITYHKTSNDYVGEFFEFSTKRVEALGGSCAVSDQYFTSLGAVSRMTSPSTAVASAPTYAGKIDGYYYYYSHPQSTCADNGTDIQIQDTAMLQTMLISVEKK